jgi:hypothetical protein
MQFIEIQVGNDKLGWRNRETTGVTAHEMFKHLLARLKNGEADPREPYGDDEEWRLLKA